MFDLTSFGIIQSLDKRFRRYRNVGWIYIFKNQSLPAGMFKVGKTSRPPPFRAQELGDATAIPSEFEVIYFVHVSDMHAAESYAHSLLGSYRVSPRKEFFSAPLSLVLKALDEVAEKYPIGLGRGMRSRNLPQVFRVEIVDCPKCGARNRVRQLAVSLPQKCGSCRELFSG